MPMAMFFYILFYVSMPFNEERTEFKKMQPISPFIYWTSVFLFDAMIHAMYAYFMYTIHIWCDVHHIFETKEYGNFDDILYNEFGRKIECHTFFSKIVFPWYVFTVFLKYQNIMWNIWKNMVLRGKVWESSQLLWKNLKINLNLFLR